MAVNHFSFKKDITGWLFQSQLKGKQLLCFQIVKINIYFQKSINILDSK